MVETAEKLLTRKFSSLKRKKFNTSSSSSLGGSSTENSTDLMTNLLKHMSTISLSTLETGFSSTRSSSSISNRLLLVGHVIPKDDEKTLQKNWSLTYLNNLIDTVTEIEYGNYFSVIIIDLDRSDSIKNDYLIFKKKIEEIEHYKSVIIGLTNNYLEIDAIKNEYDMIILMKPLDVNIVSNIINNNIQLDEYNS